MVFPGMVASFLEASNTEWVRDVAEKIRLWLSPDTWPYNIVYFFMVVGFTFFYTMVVFQQQRIPESLQRQGAFIPGVRPGRNTAVYLQKVLSRITVVGALFLGLIAILPFFASLITGINSLQLSATSLLIVVGVAIDTMRQLEAQLMMRNYEGFIN
jgi:preprotein translocase subunit SecY